MTDLKLDLIEELKLRRWARENYTPPVERQPTWHPIVHDEMSKKDMETMEADEAVTTLALSRA